MGAGGAGGQHRPQHPTSGAFTCTRKCRRCTCTGRLEDGRCPVRRVRASLCRVGSRNGSTVVCCYQQPRCPCRMVDSYTSVPLARHPDAYYSPLGIPAGGGSGAWFKRAMQQGVQNGQRQVTGSAAGSPSPRGSPPQRCAAPPAALTGLSLSSFVRPPRGLQGGRQPVGTSNRDGRQAGRRRWAAAESGTALGEGSACTIQLWRGRAAARREAGPAGQRSGQTCSRRLWHVAWCFCRYPAAG